MLTLPSARTSPAPPHPAELAARDQHRYRAQDLDIRLRSQEVCRAGGRLHWRGHMAVEPRLHRHVEDKHRWQPHADGAYHPFWQRPLKGHRPDRCGHLEVHQEPCLGARDGARIGGTIDCCSRHFEEHGGHYSPAAAGGSSSREAWFVTQGGARGVSRLDPYCPCQHHTRSGPNE